MYRTEEIQFLTAKFQNLYMPNIALHLILNSTEERTYSVLNLSSRHFFGNFTIYLQIGDSRVGIPVVNPLMAGFVN